ncbi:MAG: homoserine dehydrogenase [Pseudomonadota bacterium]
MEPYRIAIAGLGTVGAGLVRLLSVNHELLEARCRRAIRIAGVSARNRTLDRGLDLGGIQWFDDPVQMAAELDHDCFVELIGGDDGTPRDCWQSAIDHGRMIVTANKAMMATNGLEFAKQAEAAGVTIGYEGAVAASIPIVKTMRESLIGNRMTRIRGILNGTSNFILSKMREQGADLATCIREAQRQGYAEANPTFDLDGTDAAHKLSILSCLAFSTSIPFDSMAIEGIDHLSPQDFQFATRLGFEIKLLGIAEQNGARISQRVGPVLLDQTQPLAAVHGVTNAIELSSDQAGTSILEGAGAGAGATASAVIADIAALAKTQTPGAVQCSSVWPGSVWPGSVWSVPASQIAEGQATDRASLQSDFYLRVSVRDHSGVLARIAAIFAAQNISIATVIQEGRSQHNPVQLIMVTHETSEQSMGVALAQIKALDSICGSISLLRIER